MRLSCPPRHAAASVLLLAAVAGLYACSEASVAPQPSDDQLLAKPGGGGGPKVVVVSIDPQSAEQGEEDIVFTVVGTGFDETSEVTFLLNGKRTNNVTTTEIVKREPEKVVAIIAVALDAAVDFYSVEVTAQRGRKKGVGVEMLEVLVFPGGSGTVDNVRHQTEFTLADNTGDGIVSDGTGLYTPFGSIWDKADGSQDLWNVFVQAKSGQTRRIRLVVVLPDGSEISTTCEDGRLYINIGAVPPQWYNDLENVDEVAVSEGTFRCQSGKGKNVSGWRGEWDTCIDILKGAPGQWTIGTRASCPADIEWFDRDGVGPSYSGVEVPFTAYVTELD